MSLKELILSPQFTGFLLFIKIFFILTSVLLLGAIIYLLRRCSWLRRLIIEDMGEFMNYRPYGSRKVEKAWKKVKARLDLGQESEYKLALIEADAMVDDILRRMDYKGETLKERLAKITSATIPNIDKLAEAHKVRNSIVHDPDYHLTLEETKSVIEVYEKALSSLNAF